MNRQLKKRIQKAFAAPDPDRREKTRFLNALPRSRISMLQFIWIQAAYLRKLTLALSVLLLLPALWGVFDIDLNALWTVSALVPFLGLLAVTESTRSVTYGMSEFEMSTRFSLKSVMLARMSVLGLLDVLLLFCAVPLCCIGGRITFLQTGAYLFVPYLLTVNVSLWITRRFHGKGAVYACMSAAVLISTANMGLHIMAEFVYQLAYVKWWLLLFVVLAGAMIYETYCTIKRTEEAAWSL